MTVGAQSDFREQTLKIGVWSWKVEHAEVVGRESNGREGTGGGQFSGTGEVQGI